MSGNGGPCAPPVAFQVDLFTARANATGPQCFTQHFTWHAFQYVEMQGYDSPAAVSKHSCPVPVPLPQITAPICSQCCLIVFHSLVDITGYPLRSSFAAVGSWTTNNALFGRIHEMTLASVQSNMMRYFLCQRSHLFCSRLMNVHYTVSSPIVLIANGSATEATRLPLRKQLCSTSTCIISMQVCSLPDSALSRALLVFALPAYDCLAERVVDFLDVRDVTNGGFTETAPYVGIQDSGLGGTAGPVEWGSLVPTLLLQLYRYYGDSKLLLENVLSAQALPLLNLRRVQSTSPVIEWIELLLQQAGGVGTLLLDNGLGDWSSIESTPINITGSAFLAWNLDAAAELLQIAANELWVRAPLDEDSDAMLVPHPWAVEEVTRLRSVAANYTSLAQNTRSLFNKRFLNLTSGSYSVGWGAGGPPNGSPSQTAQTYAIFLQMAAAMGPQLQQQALSQLATLLQNWNSHATVGIFGIRWLLEALCGGGVDISPAHASGSDMPVDHVASLRGLDESLQRRLRGRLAAWSRTAAAPSYCSLADQLLNLQTMPSYGYMLSQNATSLWEVWQWDDFTYSHNHAMFGSVDQVRKQLQSPSSHILPLPPSVLLRAHWRCAARSSRSGGRYVCDSSAAVQLRQLQLHAV
jgi:hypothetical protein